MKNTPRILIPIIRAVAPAAIAQQLVSVQPMTSTSGDIMNIRYQGFPSMNEKYWPHQHTVEWTRLHENERWCYNNLKSRNWRNTGARFAFKRKEDYLLFLLRA